MTQTSTMQQEKRRQGARQALYASLGLIVLLAVLKTLALSSLFQKIGFTLAAAYQLYLPLHLIERGGERVENYGIHMHGSVASLLATLRRRILDGCRRTAVGVWYRGALLGVSRYLGRYAHHAHFDRQGFVKDLRQLAVICALTFPPFIVGHHVWQLWIAERIGRSAHYSFALPGGFAEMAIVNLLLVALPEELFYRGYVHTRLLRAWPPWFMRYGVPVGRAIFVASALFALGHYAGEWGNPGRLGPFFPALLFAAMRARSGAIMGAVLYHGFANIFSETLRAGYTFM